LAFAKTTTKELVNLGAKLAIGTQTVLQDAEAMLGPNSGREQWEEEGIEEDTKKQISLYADQPMGVVQGLRGAYASLERDLLLARDAIIAVPGEVMASGSASGAARAVLRQTPTIILRPAIGATKAVGQTLLGAGNTLDRDNWRRVEEVSHPRYISYCVTLRSICRSTRGIRPERHGTGATYLACYRRHQAWNVISTVLGRDHWHLEGGGFMMRRSHIGRLHVLGISYVVAYESVLQSEC
jgi:hypothetical protein